MTFCTSFFLVFGFHKLKGVGLHKPHMPQVCSSKYYGLYPLNDTFPPLAPNRYAPQGAPQVAVQTSAQLRTWINSTASQEECTVNFDIWNSSKCTLPDAEARALKRGYWACISQTDVRFLENLSIQCSGCGVQTPSCQFLSLIPWLH